MRLDQRHARQRPVDSLPCYVAVNETVRHRSLQHGPGTGTYAPGGFRTAGPDGCEHAQHVLPADPVHGHVRKDGEGVPLQRLNPGLRVLVVSPARLKRFVRFLGGMGEDGDLGLAPLGERVASVSDGDAILEGAAPGLGERDHRERTQTHVSALALDGNSLHPLLAAARCDAQIKGRIGSIKPGY